MLSLPCSSGEEPYSIAMALLDAGVPASRFQIDALDISERVVQFARRGLYGRNSFRGDALDYRDRYFTETGDGHQLSAQVMERVRFQSGNLFDAGLLAHAPAYDFVFCRNLLIYFDQATQERAVQVLRRHTREDGVLFVGPAETSLLTARRLPPVAMPHCFAFLARPRPMRRRPLPPVQARGLAGAAGIARPARARPRRSDPCPIRPALRAGRRSRRGQIGIRGRNLAAPDRGAGGPGAREGRDRAAARTWNAMARAPTASICKACCRMRRAMPARRRPLTARSCTCSPIIAKPCCIWPRWSPRKATTRARRLQARAPGGST